MEHGGFIARHIGPGDDDIAAMLDALGLTALDELIEHAVPESILSKPADPGAPPHTELDALVTLRKLAGRNRVLKSMIGMGYHGTRMPAVIQRNILENPGWYTAYTPYQPEVAQGRLEALLNFQQMIIDLTGMALANASLLDESTAAAEAMTMIRRVSRSKAGAFFVAADCHPQTIDVVKTRARPLDIDVVVGDPESDLSSHDVFGVLLQYPGTTGAVCDLSPIIARAHEAGALVAVAADPLSLVLLKSPGEMDADVVVGSAQRFGVPMGYGGPHAAYFATRESFARSLPGRIIGVSVDRHGQPALRMALQTREQHIRREKATSNICTAQVLLAVLAGMYAVYHGPDGLRRIATRVHRLAAVLGRGLEQLGLTLRHSAFFDTVAVEVADADATVNHAEQAGFNLRRIDGSAVGIALDETTTVEDVEAIWRVLDPEGAGALRVADLDSSTPDAVPTSMSRTSAILTHPVFSAYHSETEMMRYLRRLEHRDVALNRSMIPLGSCTMKLNAAAEMLPITCPAFADMHPFAPPDQVAGYSALIESLQQRLAELTGFDAVSMQPNAGSQGEFAGLLVIRAYHAAQGQADRDVCLIPGSAHGTNPASATMAGMRVVVVDCDPDGNIDIDDLRRKAELHRDQLAGTMVTYPSTHGVFEESIVEICQIIHDHGGQVYLDGANLNAMLGISEPAALGADVMHLNLHKTFAIPHGGGGPGMGPIAVKQHLAPFLPTHPVVPDTGGAQGIGAIASAPFGSPLILPISWMYIHMMGDAGLLRATQVAILSANYVAHRLDEHFPVLYRGRDDEVAHECIIDLRTITKETGITVDDVAKRLIDFGFHAPTMSWPVPGTMMIEPTESETKAELDRFCDAMITIRREIEMLQRGAFDANDNPLINAPHTAEEVTADSWDHPYSRQTAAYPAPFVRDDKYWPPVGRVDQAQGDRHLVCTCPPMDAYRDE